MGGSSGGGRAPGRGPVDRVLGGDDRGRSQGEDRRDLEQEEPSRTQATAITATHGGADGGRSHGGGRADDSRGPTDGGGGARGREPMSQGDEEDPEDHGGTGGSGDRGGGGDPEGRGGAGMTED